MYKPILKTRFIGKNIEYLTSCHSTNDIAADKVRSGHATNGDIVIADEQLAGRGQRGNSWESEKKKNFTFSLILQPEKLPVSDQFFLSQCFALGVHDYVAGIVGKRASIKWPNDILIDQKKVVGISVENTIRGSFIASSVIGIGLNMNQLEFRNPRVTSLGQATGRMFDLVEEFELLIVSLDRQYSRLAGGDLAGLAHDYQERFFGLGETRRFMADDVFFEGRILGVDPQGRLRIAVAGDERVFDIKEVVWQW